MQGINYNLKNTKEKSITQEELSSSLRSAFAQYFLREPDSKVICHKDNYSKLKFVEQLHSKNRKLYAFFNSICRYYI